MVECIKAGILFIFTTIQDDTEKGFDGTWNQPLKDIDFVDDLMLKYEHAQSKSHKVKGKAWGIAL